MAENSVDSIILSDIPIITVNYTPDLTDGVNFSDSANIFNIFKTESSSNISISDIPNGIISEYVKTVHGDNLIFSDNTSSRIDSHEKLNDNIVISDTSISHLKVSKSANDSFNIGTRSYANIRYNNDNNSDNLNISDSVFAIISRLSTRRFTNASLNLIGTTEQTLYVCNGKTSTMMNISLCNRLLSDINLDVIIYKDGITPIYIIKDVLIKPHQSYVINNNNEASIVLEDTDEIRVISNTDNSTDIYMALMEQT